MLKRSRSQCGQATVELVAVVPIVIVVALAGWQLVVGGHTWWKLHEAARLAARERYVAEQRGASRAWRRRADRSTNALLGASPAGSLRVVAEATGAVRVSARVPLVGVFAVALGRDSGPQLSARSRMAP